MATADPDSLRSTVYVEERYASSVSQGNLSASNSEVNVEKYSNGRIVACLEGGYVLSPLARSVAAHIKVLIGVD